MSAYLCDDTTLSTLVNARKILPESAQMLVSEYLPVAELAQGDAERVAYWAGLAASGQSQDEALFNALYEENMASLAVRYPSSKNLSDWSSDEPTYQPDAPFSSGWSGNGDETPAEKALLAIREYGYQSCEHDEWQTSRMHQYCEDLKARLTPIAAEERKTTNAVKAKQQAAQAAERAKLRDVSAKECAKYIRTELRRAFPGVTFSVRTDYNSVSVRWTDGPTGKQVDAIIDKYQRGSFDGMTDCYNYSDRALTLPTGERVTGGAKYVSSHRDISDGLYAMTAEKVCRERGLPVVQTPAQANAVYVENARCWLSDLVYRALREV